MMPILRYSSGLFILLLGVLAWALAAPAAHASCGDYVVYRSKDNVDGHKAVPAHASLPTPRADHTTPPRPCNGPSCSKHSAPPLTPAPAVPTVLPQWGCLLPTAATTTSDPLLAIDTVDASRPARLAANIFHPPREA